MDILNGRPDDTSFKEYKSRLRAQKALIKQKKKGHVIWLAKLHNSPVVIKQLIDAKLVDTLGQLLHKGQTFIGSTKELTNDVR